jgi:hypothetical protein
MCSGGATCCEPGTTRLHFATCGYFLWSIEGRGSGREHGWARICTDDHGCGARKVECGIEHPVSNHQDAATPSIARFLTSCIGCPAELPSFSDDDLFFTKHVDSYSVVNFTRRRGPLLPTARVLPSGENASAMISLGSVRVALGCLSKPGPLSPNVRSGSSMVRTCAPETGSTSSTAPAPRALAHTSGTAWASSSH